jgi:hypothetical protein
VLATLIEHKGGVYDLKLRGAEASELRSTMRKQRTCRKRSGWLVCSFTLVLVVVVSAQVYSCSNDFTVKSWAADDFLFLQLYAGHTNFVRALCFFNQCVGPAPKTLQPMLG